MPNGGKLRTFFFQSVEVGKAAQPGLFHSHLARLRMNSESNSESRLKTTEKRL